MSLYGRQYAREEQLRHHVDDAKSFAESMSEGDRVYGSCWHMRFAMAP